jgi:3-oxoadipate enol-lactonase
MPLAELTDSRCYYELHGSGSPVILIPGLGTTCELWSPVTQQLEQSFSVILFDNRDIGRSVSKRPPQTLVDFTVDVIELMDHLQLDRAHVIGLSLGGIVAQRLAIDHPSRVDRLVLMSCADRFGPYLREIAKLLGQSLYRFPPELFRRTIELLGTSPMYFDDHAKEIEQKIAADCDTGIARKAVVRQLRCLSCHDAVGEDYRIESPTLVIAGDHDTLVPAFYARRMSQLIPNSEFVLVPNCGHNPLIERPEFVLPRMVKFLSGAGAEVAGEFGQLALEELV